LRDTGVVNLSLCRCFKNINQ